MLSTASLIMSQAGYSGCGDSCPVCSKAASMLPNSKAGPLQWSGKPSPPAHVSSRCSLRLQSFRSSPDRLPQGARADGCVVGELIGEGTRGLAAAFAVGRHHDCNCCCWWGCAILPGSGWRGREVASPHLRGLLPLFPFCIYHTSQQLCLHSCCACRGIR